jgi:kynurenine formamidase
MEKSKLPKFKEGDIIIKNNKHYMGYASPIKTDSSREGSYLGWDDIPYVSKYTVLYLREQKYDAVGHWSYKLKETLQQYIHDANIVDIEFDLYDDYLRSLKLNKIKKMINENSKSK